MATEVVMPQMGESIAEGTITRWLVKVGDKVERDQPLFEISTDKVDAEIPSPASGTLLEIRNQEGETVPVNQVVAMIGEAGEAAAAAGARAPVRPPRPPSPRRRRGAGRRSRRPTEVKREETAREGADAARSPPAWPATEPQPQVRRDAGGTGSGPRDEAGEPTSRTGSASSRARWCATSPPRKGSTSRRSRAPAPTAA